MTKQNRNTFTDTENKLTVTRWEEGLGVKKDEGIRKVRMGGYTAVTGCEVQRREYSQQHCNNLDGARRWAYQGDHLANYTSNHHAVHLKLIYNNTVCQG